MLARFFPSWRLACFSTMFGLVMLALDNTSGLHSLMPYHRQQATALLHGHLYLSDSIDGLQPGLAWHDGKVQQVWGLGVACWVVPFQALWHLGGGTDFPDRIALGTAFVLLGYHTMITGLIFLRQGNRMFGIGFVWLILLCPGLWTLSRASQLIFEQTVLYALLTSLGILVSVVRVALTGLRRDYFLCCGLSAFCMWVRPTHMIYGLMAVLVCSFIFLKRNRSRKELLLGNATWLLSAALLGWTNWARFGSPAEFGHRLTVSTGIMVYLTRFGNPFEAAVPITATKELVGMLFLNPESRGANAFAENLFSWQAVAVRWRKMDLTAFDPSMAWLCLVAVVISLFWLVRNRRHGLISQPQNTLRAALLIWPVGAVIPLGLFYLYYPAMASRYLFDFAPAFTALLVLIWDFASPRLPKFLWVLPAMWLAYEVASAKVPVNLFGPVAGRQPAAQPGVQPAFLKDFNGYYTPLKYPAKTGIACNGYGWEPKTGFASDVVILALDAPQFLELMVSDRRALYGETARNDVYRAQIDGIELPLRQVTSIEGAETKKVMFDIPQKIRLRQQPEIVFLCFSEKFDSQDRATTRFLHAVNWR